LILASCEERAACDAVGQARGLNIAPTTFDWETDFVRHQPLDGRLWICILVAALAAVPWCGAQDWQGKGLGNSPMPPASPGMRERPTIPGPPVRPTLSSRPSAWPGAAQPEASPWAPPDQRSADAPPAGEVKPCDGSRIIARVGSDAILESEVAGAVNEFIETNKDRIPASQMDELRKTLIQQRLKPLIETKLIVQDARRGIPSEGWSHVEQQLNKHFEEFEQEKLMKKAGVTTPREFDQKLRALGTSLERERRTFAEKTLAQEWIRQQIKPEEEPTYDQMMVYYRQHQDEFTTPTRARWEELMVSFSKHPDKAVAYDAIARLGNQVVLGGAPFADAARTSSDGATAADGGRRDWTSKGALVCQALDEAIFNLPVGRMSPIIEGSTGFHIIRVTEREETTVRPFLEAQVDIKKKIMKERSDKQLNEYLAKLQARTPVWTIFDDETQVATPPQQQPLRR
jgi:parvulin-like peptidyl-prolyl isomerase